VNKYSNGQSGLTLIELIIVVLLLAGLLGAAGYLLIQGLQTWSKQSTGVSMQDQLRAIEDRMIRDLRGAKNVAQQNPSPTVSRLYFSTTTTILTFTDSGTFYEYDSTSDILYRALNGTKNPLSEANINIDGPFPPWKVTTISTIPTIFLIDVGLVTSEKGVIYSTNFSVSPRTWK
jgi:prepilin-type N-terminal cleavage/methylation domain-containing protein